MKNAAWGIGGPALAAVTTRAITIAAPPIRVLLVVESMTKELDQAGGEIQLSELPPVAPGGGPRTRLVVSDHGQPRQTAGLAMSQGMLRGIRDRVEGQVNGTFLAA